MPRGSKLIVVLLFWVALLWLADRYYFYITTNYHTDKAQVVMRMKNTDYNYVFLGSSRSECFFNTVVIDSLTGLKGYNLGLDGSEFAESYLLLSRFYDNHNKAAVVFIQADIFQMLPGYSYSYPFHEYRYLPYLNNNEVAEVVKEKRGYMKYALWKYVPFVKYAEFNTEYNVIDIATRYKHKPYLYANNGFRYLLVNAHADTFSDMRYTDERINTPMQVPAGNPYLDKIIALVKANGDQPVLIQPPVYAKIETWARQFDIATVARANKVPYIDYLYMDISHKGTLFRDYTHFDGNGAVQFSALVADSIKGAVNRYTK